MACKARLGDGGTRVHVGLLIVQGFVFVELALLIYETVEKQKRRRVSLFDIVETGQAEW